MHLAGSLRAPARVAQLSGTAGCFLPLKPGFALLQGNSPAGASQKCISGKELRARSVGQGFLVSLPVTAACEEGSCCHCGGGGVEGQHSSHWPHLWWQPSKEQDLCISGASWDPEKQQGALETWCLRLRVVPGLPGRAPSCCWNGDMPVTNAEATAQGAGESGDAPR